MEHRFPIFVVASVVVFLGVLRLSLRRRETMPGWKSLSVVSLVVVAGGMTFAKWGASTGLSWLVYYTVPALATLLIPPLVYKMSRAECAEYLVLALFMAPAIHATFSLLLGWKEYMPFLPVPSLRELFSHAA